jgi:tRNA U34 5-methylaminomethyl-2-thiouridine-forming methyltransferase MnmC
LKREIIKTADGSTTIHLPDWNEQYHSKHGAIQEAYHVFITHGLQYYLDTCNTLENNNSLPVNILEIGLGTGLNAYITLLEAISNNIYIDYTGIEAYPVDLREAATLNYTSQLNTNGNEALFLKLHETSWEEKHLVHDNFAIVKKQQMFHEINSKDTHNIIYFDAFGARVQPELWTVSIFEIMYNALKTNGVLVTYAAKGSVRRAMQAVGFTVERLPGPPGKREMLRGSKL